MVLTHAPEQLVVPAPHVVVHAPEAHTWPAVHAAVQRPQLRLSVLVFTSHPLAGLLSQLAKPVAQVPRAHVPLLQVAPALAKRQTMPQPPQLLASVPRTSVSHPLDAMPSQSAKPALQPPTTQVPATHAFTLALARRHALPHIPQLAGSVCVFTQSPEQFMVLAPHEAPHIPAEHTWPAGQARPHMPQLALSVLVLASHPLAGIMSQSAMPIAHVPRAHVPALHVAVALGRRHAVPQPPQLLASSPRTLVSQPLDAMPSQSAKPIAQRTTAHDPSAHALTLVLGRSHAVPQAPQLRGSMRVSAQ
jgi:hypothetical protein